MQRNNWILILEIPLIILLLIFCLNSFAGTYLKCLIKSEVEKNTRGKYHLTLEKLHLNLVTGSLEADNFHFMPVDKTSSSFEGSLVSMENVDIIDLFIHHKINIGIIRLNNSTFNIKAARDTASEKTGSSDFAIYDIFKNKFSSVYVHEIQVDNPGIRFYKNKSDSSLFLSTKYGKITFLNLLIDSNTVYQQKRPFNADSLIVYLKDVKQIIGDSLYTMTIPALNLSYTENKITIDSFSLVPNYSKKDFSKIVGKQCDRFNIFSKSISFIGMDVKRFIEKFEFDAKQILIDSLNVDIYRNKYIPSVPIKKKFLQELLRDLDMPLKAGELSIKNSTVEYVELTPPAKDPGKILFTQLDATFKNISNHIEDREQILMLDATGMINNESPVVTHVNIPLNKNLFTGTGSVHHIAMTNLNSMLEGTSGATVTNGEIDSLNFSMMSNESVSSGWLEMTYKDLRIAAKDVAHNDTSGLGLKIKTFIANRIIIKQSNPEKGEKLRRVEMLRDYEEDKFIIGNLWRTVLSGIKKTIGVPGDKKGK